MRSDNPFCGGTFALLQAGDFEEAIRLADCGLRSFPEEGRLWELRGIAQGCRLCVREALASLDRASSMVPLSVFGQIALAGCFVRCNRLHSAQCLAHFLASRDEFPLRLLADLAQGFDRAGRPEWSLEVCRAAVRRVPDCHPAVFAIAHYLWILDYPVEAIVPVLQQAFELCPEKTLYRVDLALLSGRCGRAADAYQLLVDVDLRELLELHCPRRLNDLAWFFGQMGDEVRASACQARVDQLAHTCLGPGPDEGTRETSCQAGCLAEAFERFSSLAKAGFTALWFALVPLTGCGSTGQENHTRDAINPTVAPAFQQSRQPAPEVPCEVIEAPVRECHELHGDSSKVWEVTPRARTDSSVPFDAVAFHSDGSWKDSSGVSGIWRIDRKRSQIAFLLDGCGTLVVCEILDLSEDLFVLQFPCDMPWKVLTLVSAN